MTAFAFFVWWLALLSERNQSGVLTFLCFINWLNLLFSPHI